MRRSWLGLVLCAPLLAAACGPAQVVIVAEIDVLDPEGEGTVIRPLAAQEIQLLPFDRDEVFDSLARAFPTEEPPIPEDLLTLQEAISEAQEEWMEAEARWAAGRDRLVRINEEMENLNRGEARYVSLYREFEDVFAQVEGAERAKDQAFERFDDLQQGYVQRADSMRLIREGWEDEAFAPAGEIFLNRLRELGRDMVVDTTDASGRTVVPVRPGKWWVHARYELPFVELYWNIPVEVERGDPVQVTLNRATAQQRPRL
jgi:hypothetical protein